MKKFFTIALCFGFMLTFGLAAQAQSPIRAHVPFAFNVGDTEFSAGNYQIFQEGSMLRIVAEDGLAKTVTTSFRTERAGEDPGTLQFLARNGKHYLAKVYAPGTQAGRELLIKN